MGIYITPLERIRKLQAENARLRSLVGEPAVVESVEGEQAEPQTLIEKTDTLQVTTSIAFVTLAEQGGIDEITATEHIHTFAPWVSGYNYALGALRVYGGKLYKCIQAHTSQADWTPDVAVSLWAVAGNPLEEWPEWSAPVGAHDAYNIGDKVAFEENHYVSLINANVWSPTAYPAGWQLQA